MDDEHISRSPPSDDYEVSPKHQKMNAIDSTTLSPSNNPVSEEDWSDQKRELADALCHRILGSGIMLNQLQHIKRQIEEIIKKEEENLHKNVDQDREMMSKLAKTREQSMWSTEENLSTTQNSQTYAEAEMLEIKRRISMEIMNLLAENPGTDNSSHEGTSTLPKSQENATETQREQSGAEEKIENGLSQLVKEKRTSQEPTCDVIGETSKQIEELHSENQGGELPLTQEPIPTLQETAKGNLACEDQIVHIPKELSGTNKCEQLVVVLPRKLTGSTVMISPSFRQADANQSHSQCDDTPADLTDTQDSARKVSNEVNSSPCSPVTNENHPRPDRWIDVRKCNVLPSDSRFFDIDWTTQYGRDGPLFICKRCPKATTHRTQMEDHIWNVHEGGGFHCYICPNPSNLQTRGGVATHMRNSHHNQQSHTTESPSSEKMNKS